MPFRFIPKDKFIVDRAEVAVQNAHAAAQTLAKLLADYGALAERRAELKEMERKGDMLTREIFDAVGRRSGARMDRQEVRALAQAIDSVVDALYLASNRLFLYDISKPPEAMKRFADIAVEQTKALAKAFGELRRIKSWPASLKHCDDIHRLENDADRLLNDTIARLFRGKDAVLMMKYKDIYETLEAATDRCDDAADAIHDIIRKRR